ncbi:SCPU domain-containing protein, partial [Acinetobacter variabilis]
MKKTFFYLSAFAVGLSALNAANSDTATRTLTVRDT